MERKRSVARSEVNIYIPNTLYARNGKNNNKIVVYMCSLLLLYIKDKRILFLICVGWGVLHTHHWHKV